MAWSAFVEGGAVASAQAPGTVADTATPAPLFASHDELAVTLTADFTQLERDRRASPDRPGTLTVAGPGGEPVEIAMQIRTRGAFRLDRSNCTVPPLRIDVDAGDAAGTVFDGQDDLKIVSSCRPGRSSYDRLVPLEYLSYRALNEVTDRSFMVRPVRLSLVDTDPAGSSETRFAFFIEDDDALAKRVGARVFELEEGRVLPGSAFDAQSAVTTGVFEYMIGNTDWSDVAGHNVTILDRSGLAIAVPYDFDFSGLVDAPYSAPTPDLGIDSVQERLYRGRCAAEPMTRMVLDAFRAARAAIVGLFEQEERLDDGARTRAVRYLQGFFYDIETDRRAELRLLRHCRGR